MFVSARKRVGKASAHRKTAKLTRDRVGEVWERLVSPRCLKRKRFRYGTLKCFLHSLKREQEVFIWTEVYFVCNAFYVCPHICEDRVRIHSSQNVWYIWKDWVVWLALVCISSSFCHFKVTVPSAAWGKSAARCFLFALVHWHFKMLDISFRETVSEFCGRRTL